MSRSHLEICHDEVIYEIGWLQRRRWNSDHVDPHYDDPQGGLPFMSWTSSSWHPQIIPHLSTKTAHGLFHLQSANAHTLVWDFSFSQCSALLRCTTISSSQLDEVKDVVGHCGLFGQRCRSTRFICWRVYDGWSSMIWTRTLPISSSNLLCLWPRKE